MSSSRDGGCLDPKSTIARDDCRGNGHHLVTVDTWTKPYPHTIAEDLLIIVLLPRPLGLCPTTILLKPGVTNRIGRRRKKTGNPRTSYVVSVPIAQEVHQRPRLQRICHKRYMMKSHRPTVTLYKFNGPWFSYGSGSLGVAKSPDTR